MLPDRIRDRLPKQTHPRGDSFIARASLLSAAAALLGLTGCATHARGELFRVTVHVLRTGSYCGGAAPTRELLDKLSTPTALSGKKMFVKKGARNSDAKTIATAVSDSAGVLTFHLPRGSYCLVEEGKTSPLVVPAGNRWESWDPDCLKQRWETCDYSLQVSGKNEDIRIVYPEYCPTTRPCLKSRIPLPP